MNEYLQSNTPAQRTAEQAIVQGLITKDDIKKYDSLKNNPSPAAQREYKAGVNDTIAKAERIYDNYVEALKKSPFDPNIHEGFITGFLKTPTINEKNEELNKLKEYITEEEKFVKALQGAEKEVKTIYDQYCQKHYGKIHRNQIKEAAQKICSTKARINSCLKQRTLTPNDAKSLLNEWQNYPPDKIGDFIKLTESKIFKAERTTKDYQKDLTKFSKLIKLTIPDTAAVKPIETDFWMFFLQDSQSQKEREQKLSDLKKFIKAEEKTLKIVNGLSPIEKKEYSKRYKDYQSKLSKEQILSAITKESGEIASKFFRFFKDNPETFSKKAQTHLCREFAKLGSFNDQRQHIQKSKKEFADIKKITLQFSKLPKEIQQKHKKHLQNLITSKERQKYLELLSTEDPDQHQKEIFEDQILSIKEKNHILKNYEAANPSERKIIYQSYQALKLKTLQAIEKFSQLPKEIAPPSTKSQFKISSLERKLEIIAKLSQADNKTIEQQPNANSSSITIMDKFDMTTAAIIDESRETVQALTLLTIAYHTAHAHELRDKGNGISAEERAAQKAETKKEEQIQRSTIQNSIEDDSKQAQVINFNQAGEKYETEKIERVRMDINEFGKEGQRIRDLHTEFLREDKNGSSPLYKDRADWTLLNNDNKVINFETARQTKKINDTKFEEEILNKTKKRLKIKDTLADDKIEESIGDQMEKRGFNDDESCARLRKNAA